MCLGSHTLARILPPAAPVADAAAGLLLASQEPIIMELLKGWEPVWTADCLLGKDDFLSCCREVEEWSSFCGLCLCNGMLLNPSTPDNELNAFELALV